MADDVFTAVGVMVVLLFILGDLYGLGPHAVYSSIAVTVQSIISLSVPAAGIGAFGPGLLLVGTLGIFYFFENYGIGDYMAVAAVFLIILLVV